MQDESIPCYLGRNAVGNKDGTVDWYYGKLTIYSLRLYNRPLNENELKNNYDKTIAAHFLE